MAVNAEAALDSKKLDSLHPHQVADLRWPFGWSTAHERIRVGPDESVPLCQRTSQAFEA